MSEHSHSPGWAPGMSEHSHSPGTHVQPLPPVYYGTDPSCNSCGLGLSCWGRCPLSHCYFLLSKTLTVLPAKAVEHDSETFGKCPVHLG